VPPYLQLAVRYFALFCGGIGLFSRLSRPLLRMNMALLRINMALLRMNLGIGLFSRNRALLEIRVFSIADSYETYEI